MSGPQFNLDHRVEYGAVDRLSTRLERVTAKNPSKFTFTGTGTYLVGDHERVVVIDPGPTDQAHVDALVAAIGDRSVTHLLITHTHGDHSPAAGLLKAHIDAPTYGFGPHPLPRPGSDQAGDGDDDEDFGFDPPPDHDDAAASAGGRDEAGYKSEHAHDWDFEPDVRVGDGEMIDCSGFGFEAIHTPGHISNHLCFALRDDSGDPPVLFSGDHVMGWSTTIIPPPDGDLNQYLASLDKLLPRSEAVYYPTHGAPITDPSTLVAALRAHRQARTDQILDCLGRGIETIKEMVLDMYDVDPKLHNAAGASVMSHLVALVATGQVTHSTPSPRPRSHYRLA